MKNLKIKITDVVDGKAESPLPLEVIPNYMGADEFAIECINFHHEKTMSTERFFELTYGGNK